MYFPRISAQVDADVDKCHGGDRNRGNLQVNLRIHHGGEQAFVGHHKHEFLAFQKFKGRKIFKVDL
jgi:hypothetical protein